MARHAITPIIISPGTDALYTAIPPVIAEANETRTHLYEIAKRVMDIAVSAVALVLGVPLFAAIALAVRATSRGPVFYKQKRLGRSRREFWCYKFRTMVPNADRMLDHDADLRKQFEASYKVKDDHRVTLMGRFLRRTSLDELPQLWNIVKGDMSLIGPRPIVPPELQMYGPYADKLLSVLPGLSGLWQTHGRSDTSYDRRVALDMMYIDHRCIWLDIKLLSRTILAVLKADGAC